MVNIISPLDKNLITPPEVEALYSIKESTQAKNRCLGKLPFIKFGKFVYYKREELEKFICSHAVEMRSR